MRQLNENVFADFPRLKTKRLTLREIRPEDAASIYEMRSNGRVNQFMPRPRMEALEESENLVQRTIQAYENRQGIGWAGVLRDGKTIIGTCGFNRIEYHNLRAEIGGEMGTAYWGKGIALEAVEAILDFGLNVFGLHTIEARVSPLNRGAVRVLEHWGFVKEAHFKDCVYFQNQFSDMAVYTLFGK